MEKIRSLTTGISEKLIAIGAMLVAMICISGGATIAKQLFPLWGLSEHQRCVWVLRQL
ncbi:hypothetical protein [Croceicoccus sp. Ery15]|uniref:hypothetical protein n=1 Tax=Croceicoccus sp. Ery15 TaxID=1703338 RepID=UPI001E419B21|nr:hypothetical protein [Croceicoccus sp. Ery15]